MFMLAMELVEAPIASAPETMEEDEANAGATMFEALKRSQEEADVDKVEFANLTNAQDERKKTHTEKTDNLQGACWRFQFIERHGIWESGVHWPWALRGGESSYVKMSESDGLNARYHKVSAALRSIVNARDGKWDIPADTLVKHLEMFHQGRKVAVRPHPVEQQSLNGKVVSFTNDLGVK